AFTLTLTDRTQNWTQTTQQTSPAAQLGSAEVIAEAPSSQAGVLPLSNFGTVGFTSADADHMPIGNSGAGALAMVAASGVTEAVPSALTGGGAFSVAFGGNAPAGATPTPTSSGGTGTGSPAPTIPASPSPSPTTTPARYHHHHHWWW
ncbi:MAG TPA: G1 family glutamic endopeptidase, partial [Streptosporangiaceae bacterium]